MMDLLKPMVKRGCHLEALGPLAKTLQQTTTKNVEGLLSTLNSIVKATQKS